MKFSEFTQYSCSVWYRFEAVSVNVDFRAKSECRLAVCDVNGANKIMRRKCVFNAFEDVTWTSVACIKYQGLNCKYAHLQDKRQAVPNLSYIKCNQCHMKEAHDIVNFREACVGVCCFCFKLATCLSELPYFVAWNFVLSRIRDLFTRFR